MGAWMTSRIGLGLAALMWIGLAAPAGALPVDVIFSHSPPPNYGDAPYGNITVYGLGGPNAYGAASPHNVISDPSSNVNGWATVCPRATCADRPSASTTSASRT